MFPPISGPAGKWDFSFSFFYYFGITAKAKESISSWEEGNLGSPMLSIVSQSFIPLRFDGRIICFKWHRAVDSREAYCPPFMSLIKDAQREPLFQPLGRRRESAITLSLISIKPPFIHLPLRTAASTSPEEEAVECEEALAAACSSSLWRWCAE